MARCDDCMKKPIHPDKKCCFNCARVGTDCEVWHNCGEDCPGWEKKIVTNADWIRAMTDAELAEFIRDVSHECQEAYIGVCRRCKYPWCSSDSTEEWLKQPAEDDC